MRLMHNFIRRVRSTTFATALVMSKTAFPLACLAALTFSTGFLVSTASSAGASSLYDWGNWQDTSDNAPSHVEIRLAKNGASDDKDNTQYWVWQFRNNLDHQVTLKYHVATRQNDLATTKEYGTEVLDPGKTGSVLGGILPVGDGKLYWVITLESATDPPKSAPQRKSPDPQKLPPGVDVIEFPAKPSADKSRSPGSSTNRTEQNTADANQQRVQDILAQRNAETQRTTNTINAVADTLSALIGENYRESAAKSEREVDAIIAADTAKREKELQEQDQRQANNAKEDDLRSRGRKETDLSEKERLYRALITLESSVGDSTSLSHADLAETLTAEKKYGEAEVEYSVAIHEEKSDPNDRVFFVNWEHKLAQTYSEDSKFDEAAVVCRDAIADDPDTYIFYENDKTFGAMLQNGKLSLVEAVISDGLPVLKPDALNSTLDLFQHVIFENYKATCLRNHDYKDAEETERFVVKTLSKWNSKADAKVGMRDAQSQLAEILLAEGKGAEATGVYQEIEALDRQMLASSPETFGQTTGSAKSYFVSNQEVSLAETLSSLGKGPEAQTEYKKAEVLVRQQIAEPEMFANDFEDKQEVLTRLRLDLGHILDGQGRTAEAQAEYKNAENLAREMIAAAGQHTTKYSNSFSVFWAAKGDLFNCLTKQNRYSEAEDLCHDAIDNADQYFVGNVDIYRPEFQRYLDKAVAQEEKFNAAMQATREKDAEDQAAKNAAEEQAAKNAAEEQAVKNAAARKRAAMKPAAVSAKKTSPAKANLVHVPRAVSIHSRKKSAR